MINKLKLLFSKSEMSADDLKDILSFLKNLTNDEQNELFMFLSAHPEWIGKIGMNLVQKKKAVASRSVMLWENIIKQEIKDLVSIIK